jgi:hypothetical protein
VPLEIDYRIAHGSPHIGTACVADNAGHAPDNDHAEFLQNIRTVKAGNRAAASHLKP